MTRPKKSSLYTRKGDKGDTSFLDGAMTSKSSPLLDLGGGIDELNSFTGLLMSRLAEETEVSFAEDLAFMREVQRTLFLMGSLVTTKKDQRGKMGLPDDLDGEALEGIERRIDELDASLPPLRNFVLPSGDYRASLAHVCRSACRRVERDMDRAARTDDFRTRTSLTDSMRAVINRLSDYFFALARSVNAKKNVEDETWRRP